MKIGVTKELLALVKEISVESKTDEEWAGVEADDMFQSAHYCGGYDATERAFLFSYHDDNGAEYFFQFSTSDVPKILAGELEVLEGSQA